MECARRVFAMRDAKRDQRSHGCDLSPVASLRLPQVTLSLSQALGRVVWSVRHLYLLQRRQIVHHIILDARGLRFPLVFLLRCDPRRDGNRPLLGR